MLVVPAVCLLVSGIVQLFLGYPEEEGGQISEGPLRMVYKNPRLARSAFHREDWRKFSLIVGVLG